MNNLEGLRKRNQAWATAITNRDPTFFSELVEQQTQEYLWIGCSDSRAPANQIIDLPPD